MNKEASSKPVKTIEEFKETYVPEYLKKYPITMDVSEEERKHILFHRGGLYGQDNQQ